MTARSRGTPLDVQDRGTLFHKFNGNANSKVLAFRKFGGLMAIRVPSRYVTLRK